MKKVLLYIVIPILIFTSIIIYIVSDNYFIECEDYLNNIIKAELNESINQSIINDIQYNKISFEDILNYNYLENGKIASIHVDSQKLNLITSDITLSIQRIIKESKNKFGIPYTNLMGSRLFAEKGPKLSVIIAKNGSVDYKIDSQLISGGINQTLHRITLTFDTSINCTAPFQNLSFNIENTIIVSETMIVGEVPQIILPSK